MPRNTRVATKLSEKHWQALQFIDEGKMSLREIAKHLGWEPGTLYDLYEGDVEKSGQTGILFKAEVSKLSQKNLKRIKDLTCDNKALCLRMINDFLRRKMSLGYQSDDDVKQIVSVYNALSKSTAGVEIHNTTFSYIKGLSAEERVHEYIKLRTLAEGSSVRGVSTADRVDQVDQ